MNFGRRSFAVAVLAASTLLLPAAEPRAQASDKLEKVEVLLDWKALPTYAGFFLAKDLGAFERRGLDVTFGEVQGAILGRRGDRRRIEILDRLVERHGHGDRPLEGPADQEPGRLLPQDAERDLQPRRGPHRPPARPLRQEARHGAGQHHQRGIPRPGRASTSCSATRSSEVTVDWDPWALLEKKVDALIDYEEMTPAELLAEGRRIIVMRLSDFGVRSLQPQPDRQRRRLGLAGEARDRRGRSSKRCRKATAWSTSGRAMPPPISRGSSRGSRRAMSTAARCRSPSSSRRPPVGGQTRQGWEETINLLTSLNLLAGRSRSTRWRSWNRRRPASDRRRDFRRQWRSARGQRPRST